MQCEKPRLHSNFQNFDSHLYCHSFHQRTTRCFPSPGCASRRPRLRWRWKPSRNAQGQGRVPCIAMLVRIVPCHALVTFASYAARACEVNTREYQQADKRPGQNRRYMTGVVNSLFRRTRVGRPHGGSWFYFRVVVRTSLGDSLIAPKTPDFPMKSLNSV